MIDINEQTDEQALGQENARRTMWKAVQDLEVQLQLGVVVTHRAMTEHLARPTSLETWKSWLVNDALRRIWQGVAQDDVHLLLSSSAMLMNVAKLDAAGIVCSLRLPAFPQAFLQKQPLLRARGPVGGAQGKNESRGWAVVLATRNQCLLSDAVLLAREVEELRPIPTTLSTWQEWFLQEAISNALLAATDHDNPPTGGGSAWLFRLAALEIAGAARLYNLGVRPSVPQPVSPSGRVGGSVTPMKA